jgi:cobyrinic acid a,c-diamide synthase
VPRLLLSGAEPGPAVALAAGALAGGLQGRVVRPVTIGLDVPLWRLLYEVAGRAPRVLDPALHEEALAAELYDLWSSGADLVVLVAAAAALDPWRGVARSRPVDVAARFDAPLVFVLDARGRGPTAAAVVCGVKALAGRAEMAGVVVVGGDDPGGELAGLLRTEVGVPVLGWLPARLAERFAHEYAPGAAHAGGAGHGRRGREGGLPGLCREAASFIDAQQLAAAAARRGYLPAPGRRALSPIAAGLGLRLAVAWGPPLQPLALENIDVLQAAGLELVPVNVVRDRGLPDGVHGLLASGQLDEGELAGLAANRELLGEIAAAVGDGLPTLALGGGALLLLRRLSDSGGRSHELAGALPAEAELLEWYDRPRYVRAWATRDNPFDDGENVLYELFDLEFLVLEHDAFAYRIDVDGAGEKGGGQAEGFARRTCLATTLYPSLPLCPRMAARFVDAMRAATPWSGR